MNKLAFNIEGQPIPKERPRVYETARGRRRTITPDKTKDWEQWCAWMGLYAMQQNGWQPLTCELRVTLEFRREDKRAADLDNLIKAVLDGLNGVIWRDDSQIVDIHARLVRGSDAPGVSVEVEAG